MSRGAKFLIAWTIFCIVFNGLWLFKVYLDAGAFG